MGEIRRAELCFASCHQLSTPNVDVSRFSAKSDPETGGTAGLAVRSIDGIGDRGHSGQSPWNLRETAGCFDRCHSVDACESD
jgi:hypothetical protein